MIRRALLRALLLAPIVAVLDEALTEAPLHGPHAWVANALLAMVAAIALGVPVFLLTAALRSTPAARSITRIWHTGPSEQARVLVYAAYTAAALSTLWLVGVACVLHARAAFAMPRVAAVFSGSEVVVAALVVAGVGALVLPPLAHRVAHNTTATRWLTCRAVTVLGSVACATLLLSAVKLTAHWFGPLVDASPAYAATGVAIAVVAILVLPLRRCSALLTAGVCTAIAIASGAMLRDPSTRAAVATGGPFARTALRIVYAGFDRDGDGVPGWLGADCDDDDPTISPLAVDIAGNGIDENCSGADAPLATRGRADLAPAGRPPDIVLITIDTLRADHLGLYGYPRATSPQLDAYARRAVVFETAEAPAAVTRFSLPGILFGRYIRAHGASAPTTSLASTLLAHGYRTHAIVALPHVLTPVLEAGFQLAMTVSPDPDVDNAHSVTNAALDWIGDAAAQPRFLWVHYADPHYPYTPAEAVFGTSDHDLYDAEIAEADRELGRLLAQLSARDNTIVVITADHGEAFGERDYAFHGQTLFQDQIHVPLLIAGPNVVARRIPQVVSLTSIAPTLLELARIPVPAVMSNVSLSSVVTGSASPPGRAVAELTRGKVGISRNALVLIEGSTKIIWDIDDDSYSSYDLATDPDERHDLGTPTAVSLQRFREILDSDLAALPEQAPLASIGARR